VKNFRKNIWVCLIYVAVFACSPLVEDDYAAKDLFTDSGLVASTAHFDTAALIAANTAEIISSPGSGIETKNVTPQAVVAFAQTLIGTPYKYASSDPKAGFDCSGFITYVFNHFDIAVPRSSRGFENIGENIPRTNARPGDLILFTGTDHTERTIGHMGIVTFNSPDTLLFIHSTSGRLNSVTVTPLNEYYQSRFVKVIRIFEENNEASQQR
jgi:cell wall-associated NlpC family hydrolase